MLIAYHHSIGSNAIRLAGIRVGVICHRPISVLENNSVANKLMPLLLQVVKQLYCIAL